MRLTSSLREGLCLVGQVASPIQAVWMGSYMIDFVNGTAATPWKMLCMYKMWLLRQAHGMVPKYVDRPLQVLDPQEEIFIETNLQGSTKVCEFLEAERRLQGDGFIRQMVDLYGKLPLDNDITTGAVTGHFALVQKEKIQRKPHADGQIKVTLQTHQESDHPDNPSLEVNSGVFVFEILNQVATLPRLYHRQIFDSEGNEWRLDERIRHDVTFKSYFEVCAWGEPSQLPGLGDRCIDRQARRMLIEMDALKGNAWIPASQCILLVTETQDPLVNHWLVAALHGVLRGCAALQGHWILLEIMAKGNALHVCWDGLNHDHRAQIMKFAETARRQLVLRTLMVSFNAEARTFTRSLLTKWPRTRVEFGSIEDAAPYPREDKSITLDALAILSTAPVPPASQGLMPVTDIRSPAIYLPAKEAILIEGSLIQLTDSSIARKQDASVADAQPIHTLTFKIIVWQDEWSGRWEDFSSSPVRKIMEKFPRLMLCRGDRCGPDCKRFHAPVDCELDQVVVDLWGRSWLNARGKRVNPAEAEQFNVLMRIPKVCADGLQQRSGTEGIYIEPRKEDGRSPSEDFTVVWLQGLSKSEATHKLKVADRGVALARFGSRFGIRVLTRDAEQLHKEMRPDTPFQQVSSSNGDDQHGQGWLVGAEDPPPSTTSGDILVTLHKKQEQGRNDHIVLTSAKTKDYMKKSPASSSAAPSQDKENVMPWNGVDPWGGFNKFRETGEQDHPMGRTTKLDQLQSQMQDAVQNNVKDVTEQRFQRLESGLTELREQNQKLKPGLEKQDRVPRHCDKMSTCCRARAPGPVKVQKHIQYLFWWLWMFLLGSSMQVVHGSNVTSLQSGIPYEGSRDAFLQTKSGLAVEVPEHAGDPKYSPRTCSVTDQFLRFLRERSQTIEATAQMDVEDPTDWDDFPPGEDAGEVRQEGDVSVLESRGGDRRSYIILQAVDTLEDIVRIIGYWTTYASLQEVPLTAAYQRIVGGAMSVIMANSLDREKGMLNAMILQRALLATYFNLYQFTGGHRLRQGTLLVLATADTDEPEDVHPVRMDELQYGAIRSTEFALLLEQSVNSHHFVHSWAGRFVEPHNTIHLLSLPQTLNRVDQVLVVRPTQNNMDLSVVIAEIRIEIVNQNWQGQGGFEIALLYTQSPAIRFEILRKLRMDYDAPNCLVSANGHIMTERNEAHDLPDGSVVRILYAPPDLQEDNSQTLHVVSDQAEEESKSGFQARVSKSSVPHQEAQPQYLPGTLHHILIYVLYLSSTAGHPTGRTLRANQRGIQKGPTVEGKLRWLVWGGLPLCWMTTLPGTLAVAGSTGGERIGEAQHPGPPLWIGTTNPSGVSNKERSISELPYGELRGWGVLQRAGWKEAQALAHELWGQDYAMTFRNSTSTDHVLLSPELLPFVTAVQ
eukprot:s203_g7.t1